MKKILFITMMMTAMCVGLASCSKDNDEEQEDKTTGFTNGCEYVDLGLSAKWATCNLGASSPEEYGNYYAWAETEPRAGYSWDYDYGYTPYYLSGYSNKDLKWSKYTGSDGKMILDPEDDAATVALGSPWRMPTYDDFLELLDHCTWTRTSVNGKKGFNVVGPNGNSIFLPAAGWRYGASLKNAGTNGRYWSSSLHSGFSSSAYDLIFDSTYPDLLYTARYNGGSVRPVRP